MKRLDEYEISKFTPQEPVSDPQVSPDGETIAFTYTEVNYEENRYDSSLWLKKPGEKERRLTYHHSDSSPRWSPDGTMIAFLSGRSPVEGAKGKQLWVIPVDGGEARRITELPWGARSPVWSQNGDALFSLSEVHEGEKVEGSDVKIIRRIHFKYDPGRGVYAGRRIHLFKVDLDGNVEQLTSGEYDIKDLAVHPSGESVAFTSNLDEYADLTWFKNIYSLDVETQGVSKLMDGKEKGVGNLSRLGWNPDGSRLAFSGRPMESMEYVKYHNQEVFTVDRDGNVDKLTTSLDRRIGVSATIPWSSDSKYVYFTKPDKGSRHLCRVDMDGNIDTLTEGKFNVGGFSITDGYIALTYTNTREPAEIFTLKEGELSNETKMSPQPDSFVEPEEFWFTATDGVKVQGWVIPPKNREPGKKYPTILQIHGGPRVHFGYQYQGGEHEFQVLSEHGFAVIYTNPRGSVGYGETFSGEIQGDWGNRDYQDLMNAVDYVIDYFDFVDRDKLGVCGGSYAGYMTNWIIGHTARFKASIAMRSITNWITMSGNSCVAFELGYPQHDISRGKPLWKDFDNLWDMSPLKYVDRVKHPHMFIVSEGDHRCPMGQAEEMFTALKQMMRVTEIIRFPNEGHGVSREGSPSHRVERLRHIVRWFDRHLN